MGRVLHDGSKGGLQTASALLVSFFLSENGAIFFGSVGTVQASIEHERRSFQA
jgi:hypothetical protein